MKQPTVRRFAGEGVALARGFAFSPLIDESRRASQDASMRILKVFAPLTIMLAAAVSIASLWNYPGALAVALALLAALKHKIFPIKYELGWFIFVGFLGAFAESIIIQAGAWSYASVQIANIPIWLPAIWGLTGTSLVVFYSGLSGQN